ncbi:MAG: hypothetical protein AAF570_29290, partial [Bacteroidota bacterium]
FWEAWQDELRNGRLKNSNSSLIVMIFAASYDFSPATTPFMPSAGNDHPKMYRLPEIGPISADELDAWVRDRLPDLMVFEPRPAELLDEDTRAERIQYILENSYDGEIDMVFERLCEECHCDFTEFQNTLYDAI